MSDQTGFSYEVMLSRLHGGLCAFQSLRSHRRQREQAAEPAPTPEPRVTPEPPRAVHRPTVDEQASPEPQAFVTVGGRMVPLFGNMDGLFGAAAAPSATVPTAPPMTPPAAPPVVEETRPLQSVPTPAPPASTLKLPPPTPPPRLGLIYGGHPPTPEPATAAEPATATPQTPSHEPPARPHDPAQAQGTPSSASLSALLDARAKAEAQRLEQVHAEHRAALAIVLREHQDVLRAHGEADAARTTQLLREHRDELRAHGEADAARTTQLLREHRDELRAQREADAARTAQLLRDIFAEHRAELTRTYESHADHLAQQTHADPAGLRAALLEQASLQREANEHVADHISELTTIVADLGQTVGMLAVAAAHKAQQIDLPPRPTFPAPPRCAPSPVMAHVPSTPQVERVAAVAPRIELGSSAVTFTTPLDPSPTAANQPRGQSKSTLDPSLAHATADEPAHRRPLHVKLAQEAAERARVQEALASESDDDLEADPTDDNDDLRPRRRLSPCTDLIQRDDQERYDDV